jgi:hypothetical protein
MQHRFKKMTSTGLDQQKFRTWVDENKTNSKKKWPALQPMILEGKLSPNFFQLFQAMFITSATLAKQKNKNIFWRHKYFLARVRACGSDYERIKPFVGQA